MTFHITYEVSPELRNNAQQRFKQTGAPPPAGVKMIGRWHCAQALRGFMIVESTDAAAIARFVQGWSDLLSFEVTPVISDEELAGVIG